MTENEIRQLQEKIRIEQEQRRVLEEHERRREKMDAAKEAAERYEELARSKLPEKQPHLKDYLEHAVPDLSQTKKEVLKEPQPQPLKTKEGDFDVIAGSVMAAGVLASKLLHEQREKAAAEQRSRDQQVAKDREHAQTMSNLNDRTRALEIENTIRFNSEKEVARIQEKHANAFKEATRVLGDKYKDDPVKQQEVLTKLEQSRPQHQIEIDKRIEAERAKADQLIQETLKRENLLAAREANDRAAEREREAQRLAAKQLEERNRNSR